MVRAWTTVTGDGWLTRLGYKDSKGGSSLLLAGVIALTSNVMVGPRLGYFIQSKGSGAMNNTLKNKIIMRTLNTRSDKIGNNSA